VSRLLVIDDDDLTINSYTRTLERLGHAVESASNGREALERFRGKTFDTILSDLEMPDMDGIAFLRELRSIDLDIPVVIITGSPSLETAARAIEYGAFRYLNKPVPTDELASLVERAVRIHEMARMRRLALSFMEQSGHALGDRASLEARFESAMSSLRMAFQPIISWSERKVVAYEALLRTQETTLMRPDHFIDAASRLERLPELGRRVRATVAKDVEAAPHDVRIFTNLHASDLTDDELSNPDAPLSKLAGRVTLEITERSSLKNSGDLQSRFKALRALGYRLAVDDLGAGYAGLASLSLVDPEVVKLDMSLVRDVDKHGPKQEVIKSMTNLARSLNMDLIVEGVETPAERDVLATLGCDLMQGYLFARPGFGFAVPDLKAS
jgi:EAL domain-containing protein (putative c-di-GMP-specific phosphodiesterase class I)/CheY-like chemotaxis protein